MSEEQKTAEELIADAMNAADNAEDIAEDAAGRPVVVVVEVAAAEL